MSINYHAIFSSPDEVAASFRTDVKEGLKWNECDSRLAIHGHNEFKPEDEPKILSRYLEQLKNPLIQLLLASVVISLFMGQFDDAISITLVSLRSTHRRLSIPLTRNSDKTPCSIFSKSTGYTHCHNCCTGSRVSIREESERAE